jgi:hypothetical protein
MLEQISFISLSNSRSCTCLSLHGLTCPRFAWPNGFSSPGNIIEPAHAAIYSELTSSIESSTDVSVVAFASLDLSDVASGLPANRPIMARILAKRECEWTAAVLSVSSVDTPILAHIPPKHRPGWNTVSAITATIIIGPSKTSKMTSLLAKAPPKPAWSSATR